MRNIFSGPAAASLYTISIPNVKKVALSLFYQYEVKSLVKIAGLSANSLSGLVWIWKADMKLRAAHGRSYVAF